MEDLTEYTKYTITHIKRITFRNKPRFALKFLEEPKKIFISNSFFEKEIDRKGYPKHICTMETLKEKTTETKTKQLQVIL